MKPASFVPRSNSLNGSRGATVNDPGEREAVAALIIDYGNMGRPTAAHDFVFGSAAILAACSLVTTDQRRQIAERRGSVGCRAPAWEKS